ncbi:hypothetical protein N7519_010222 [Penicillium mononematosum]|uniref:uncharacterized protein n=1 Tax=Penicillium mononematosum TaxID=268346 RepID=UPI002546A781|nr:uncharacterized protein N7519_010222 [Penicillium mononematosum]KAJ6179761.1 hypothetical protein N7519_010222 [Penicillium mononematosum]
MSVYPLEQNAPPESSKPPWKPMPYSRPKHRAPYSPTEHGYGNGPPRRSITPYQRHRPPTAFSIAGLIRHVLQLNGGENNAYDDKKPLSRQSKRVKR